MNSVSVNLKTDEIVIKIIDDASQENILEDLKIKVQRLKKLYKDSKTPIRVTGKILKNIEVKEIEEIIKSEINVEVNFDTPQELGLSSIKRSYKKDVGTSETVFHKGSLRSGQRMEVEGSVVIIGDVNSGAEIIAADNIIVVGNLRGLAHAGAKGNKKAIIAASKLDVVQIRISTIVKELDNLSNNTVKENAYVYVSDDEIKID